MQPDISGVKLTFLKFIERSKWKYQTKNPEEILRAPKNTLQQQL